MPPQSETMEALQRNDIDPRRPSLTRIGCNSTTQNSEAPRSVYVTPIPLTRELSDLSGSYANGCSAKNSIPATIYQEQTPGNGPWRQAYVASKLPPDASKSMSSALGRRSTTPRSFKEAEEFVDESADGKLALGGLEKHRHNRIPVNVLLMDGTKRSYELLQIWIDRAVDSVRDVVQGIQRGIPNTWKLTYDGIFQVRGNRFTQMIHILRMAKYDIQPHEILIAKPLSMTAKVTISFATSAIRHLTSVRIINTDEQDKSGRRLFRPKAEDSPLLLSNAAQERIYSTTSILTHHHSTQFLTFSPPFNSHVPLTEQSNDETSSNISSLGMGSHYQGGLVDDLMKSLRAKSREQQFTPSTEKAQAEHSTNGDLLYPSITFEEPDLSSIMNLNQLMRFSRDDSSSSIRSRRNASGVISHLNCWKTRERVAALACCPSPPNFEIQEMTLNCCKARDMNHTLLASVAEEKYKVEEEKCNVLDVRPVPEDSGRQEYGSKISAPSLSGIDTDSSIFYVMRGNTRIRLMEI